MSNPKELPQYWLVLDSQGQAQYIGHTEMPMFSQARKKSCIARSIMRRLKKRSRRRRSGRQSMTRRMALTTSSSTSSIGKARVVRLEVTPKILESKQIGEDTYRGFLEGYRDTKSLRRSRISARRAGEAGISQKIVGGAHASEDLEKMGALGRTEGEPVSFYVQVIPIGEKPAARAVAVGARAHARSRRKR